jgi:hypothetical protein
VVKFEGLGLAMANAFRIGWYTLRLGKWSMEHLKKQHLADSNWAVDFMGHVPLLPTTPMISPANHLSGAYAITAQFVRCRMISASWLFGNAETTTMTNHTFSSIAIP